MQADRILLSRGLTDLGVGFGLVTEPDQFIDGVGQIANVIEIAPDILIIPRLGVPVALAVLDADPESIKLTHDIHFIFCEDGVSHFPEADLESS